MKFAMAVGNNPSKIKINNVSVLIFGGGPSMAMAHKTTHTDPIKRDVAANPTGSILGNLRIKIELLAQQKAARIHADFPRVIRIDVSSPRVKSGEKRITIPKNPIINPINLFLSKTSLVLKKQARGKTKIEF